MTQLHTRAALYGFLRHVAHPFVVAAAYLIPSALSTADFEIPTHASCLEMAH